MSADDATQLTDDSVAASLPEQTVDVVETEIEAGADTEVEAEAESGATPAEPVVKRPPAFRKWLAHNRKAVAASAVALFVVAGGFAGAAVQPYLMERAMVTTKFKIARTAAEAITTLWSYTPEDMDRLSERSAKYLGGDFEDQYRKYVDVIAPTNKQAKVTSTTKVVGVGVESVRGEPLPDEATAIVYTNTTSSTPKDNGIPSMKYLSYRLQLHREGRDWRVTKMTTITSLDLSPKLGM